jgi:hypothetical protein
MKFLKYIQEEYCDLYRVGKTSISTTVYENPDISDLKHFKDCVLRYTAVNDKKKLFIWDATYCNHHDMVMYLVSRKHIKKHVDIVAIDPNLFNGTATVSGNKLKMIDSDDFMFYSDNILLSRLKKNWDWLEKYFVDIDYIHKLQKEA